MLQEKIKTELNLLFLSVLEIKIVSFSLLSSCFITIYIVAIWFDICFLIFFYYIFSSFFLYFFYISFISFISLYLRSSTCNKVKIKNKVLKGIENHNNLYTD